MLLELTKLHVRLGIDSLNEALLCGAIAAILCLALYKPVQYFIHYLLNKNTTHKRGGALLFCIIWALAWMAVFLGQPVLTPGIDYAEVLAPLMVAGFVTFIDFVILYLARR